LDFSFILPGSIRKNRQLFRETNKKELNEILMLKGKLITIGYNPCEVDYMIKTFSNGVKITKLDSIRLQQIQAKLEAQLSIARQCIDIVARE